MHLIRRSKAPTFEDALQESLRKIKGGFTFALLTKDALYGAVDPNAIRFDTISYFDVLQKDLKIMDQTAITLCKDNNIDLCVFNMSVDGNIAKACNGDDIGTTISGGK